MRDLIVRYVRRELGESAYFELLRDRATGAGMILDTFWSSEDRRQLLSLARPDGGFESPTAMSFVREKPLWVVARNLLRDRQRRDVVDACARRRLGMATVRFNARAIDELIDRVDEDELRAALNELPDDQRDAVVGRVAGGLEYAELAGRFGASEEAVRARVSRGLRALRLRLSGGRP